MGAATKTLPRQQYDTTKIRKDVKKMNEFVDAIEKVGGEMPELKSALKKLTIAIETGLDLADAAEETRQALAAYTEDLYRACALSEDEFVCRAGIDRQWQARNVKWVLDWNKQDSTVRNFVRNFLCSRLPERLTKNLEMCTRRKQ